MVQCRGKTQSDVLGNMNAKLVPYGVRRKKKEKTAMKAIMVLRTGLTGRFTVCFTPEERGLAKKEASVDFDASQVLGRGNGWLQQRNTACLQMCLASCALVMCFLLQRPRMLRCRFARAENNVPKANHRTRAPIFGARAHFGCFSEPYPPPAMGARHCSSHSGQAGAIE